MATDKNTPNRRLSNNLVVTRDGEGCVHYVQVMDHPAGRISICDDEMIRTMSISNTGLLVLALIHAMGGTLEERQ